jgi:hypothetical protein
VCEYHFLYNEQILNNNILFFEGHCGGETGQGAGGEAAQVPQARGEADTQTAYTSNAAA